MIRIYSLILSVSLFSILSSAAFASVPTELVGRWVQPCQGKAVREEIFDGTSARLTETYYADEACTVPLLQFRNEGGITADSGWMDFSFTRVTVTALHEVFTEDFNSREVCGVNDWQTGIEKEITARPCALFSKKPTLTPKVGEMRYGIYKVEGNRLYFGRLTLEHNALTPDGRPLYFDSRFYLRQ